jgi:hypothetical protein
METQNISFEVDELRPYVVKVLRPDNRVSGTGFFCRPDGFVLTCRHVVDPLLKKASWGCAFWRWISSFAGPKRHPVSFSRPKFDGLQSNAVFLSWDGVRLEARFRTDLSPEEADLAVLEVLSSPPSGLKDYPFLPLDVSWRVAVGHRLESFGFPQGKEWSANGISAGGNLGGMTRIQLDGVKGLKGVWAYTLEGFNMDNVQGGFSGAPVLDRDIHKVIGLIVAKSRRHQAFLVPLKPLLFERWPELRDFHDVRVAIRKSLAEEAKRQLDAKLDKTPFVLPELELGVLPSDESRGGGDDDGRRWSPVGAEELLQLSGRHVLSADVGTGKTTLLLWLRWKFLDKTEDVLPHACPVTRSLMID